MIFRDFSGGNIKRGGGVIRDSGNIHTYKESEYNMVGYGNIIGK